MVNSFGRNQRMTGFDIWPFSLPLFLYFKTQTQQKRFPDLDLVSFTWKCSGHHRCPVERKIAHTMTSISFLSWTRDPCRAFCPPEWLCAEWKRHERPVCPWEEPSLLIMLVPPSSSTSTNAHGYWQHFIKHYLTLEWSHNSTSPTLIPVLPGTHLQRHIISEKWCACGYWCTSRECRFWPEW